MRISMGRQSAGPKFVLVLATLAGMAGLGYAFWYLAFAVQCWVASSPWATQIIQ